MRLIDADTLNYKPGTFEGSHITCSVVDRWTVNHSPTVDAVHVVRCKDCKYYTGSKNRCDHPRMDYDVECYDQWLEVNPDDFCSYGERRTNA